MRLNLISISLVTVFATMTMPAYGEGITREQGDTIVNELKQIRQLLDKQQRPAAPPTAPAPPERVRLKLGNDYVLGREDAPLLMVEYTDYQCSFCNRFYTTTFPEIKKQYIDTGKLRFITRDFPLDFHQHALKAAQATRCAGEQGKFWPMKDTLMVNSARLTPELITSLAREVATDMNKFQSCMDEGKYITQIKEGMTAAQNAGISGTPSFILGKVTGDTLEGYRIVGAQPFSAFEARAKEIMEGK